MILPLETLFKSQRDNLNEDFRLRIHRAISWLKKANDVNESKDICFITLWISFNAAYAKELSNGRALDKPTFMGFINKVCKLDTERLLENTIWNNLPRQITRLVQNKYTFQPFWNYYNGHTDEKFWIDSFKS
ncbi:hypothetical protein ACWIVU_10530, partial [Ursidibacter arcticus]